MLNVCKLSTFTRCACKASFTKYIQHVPSRVNVRGIVSPAISSSENTRLFTEILEDVQSNISVGRQHSDYVTSILPQSQDALPPRSMEDSLISAIIPIGSNPDVRLKYTSHIGGARLGRLIQDMDHFAACVVYKHILNPLQPSEGPSAHAVVTARMDHLHLQENIKNDADIKLIGHVTWVGSSSAEVKVSMDQEEGGTWKKVCDARFVMVAREASTGKKSAPINALIVKTFEENTLFKLGEKNIELRAKADQDSLFKEPPSRVENNLIHTMFLSTVDHKARSFAARVKPEGSAWMTDSKLKSVMLCEPEHKNDYNKIFGGLIMERCLDLSFINTWVYAGADAVPVCTHIDDVVFLRAVEIGDLLYFHSQVVFTHENNAQVRVSAEVLDKKTQKLKLTNVLQVTFKFPFEIPHVVPKSYHEAMAYLTGRRHFLISLEKEGLLKEGEVEEQTQEVTKYAPLWTLKTSSNSVNFEDESMFKVEDDVAPFSSSDVKNEMCLLWNSEDSFMGAEMTRCIRDKETGAM